MSFSSQRTFFRVPFRDEEPRRLPERKRSDCQLKSYHSCADFRAMSMDPKVSAQYAMDVVHKARWPRVIVRPSGGLTREYLMFIETEELVDFVMIFMEKLEKANTKLAEYEQNRRGQQEQIELVQRAAEQELVQQRTEVVDQAKVEEELADLKDIILRLKCKADRCDCLEQENHCLRKKIHCLKKEKKPEMKEKCDEKIDCGDSPQVDADKVKAEMALIRNYCEELKQQKRTLMEELQKSKINHCKVSDLRNLLIQEQCWRELLQEKFDNLQIQHDVQAIELERKKNYITMCNRRLEKS
ncbi:uncharacterized protein LOC120431156 isoform X1 [Culex pipiens pallens]|uniref:uncharacterized protein LOC120431156 isoform X1 n=2 Tax=Culex pipiens pallens TaxID=42434 RepID=UPI001954917F|nr:uncharacterized protein LOC120431156 isoform X1 [Culex pipiens pallens]